MMQLAVDRRLFKTVQHPQMVIDQSTLIVEAQDVVQSVDPVAPPVGDIAVGSMYITKRSFVNAAVLDD